jgi:hypothetical protein
MSSVITQQIFQFEPEIVTVVPARLADGIPDLVVDGLNRANQMRIEAVVHAKLCVGARPGAALSDRTTGMFGCTWTASAVGATM